MKNNWVLKGLVITSFLMPLAAQADVSYVFNTDSDCVSASPGGCGGWDDERTYRPDGGSPPVPEVNVTSWYMNTTDGSSNTFNDTLTQAKIANFSSGGELGAARNTSTTWTTSPLHAISNYNGDLESILFDFGAGNLIALNQLQLGYRTDSDLAILAYTGGNASTSVAGSTYGSLIAGDWDVVTSIYNATTNSFNNSSNSSDNTYSRYWMVVAANTQVGFSSNYVGNDAFKLSVVAGAVKTPDTTPGVPEPATLALMGIGLIGMGAARRKKQTKQS